jgi:hypothetical protein
MNATVDVWDPWVDREAARAEFGLDLLEAPPASGSYDAVLLAVPHREFTVMGPPPSGRSAGRGRCSSISRAPSAGTRATDGSE